MKPSFFPVALEKTRERIKGAENLILEMREEYDYISWVTGTSQEKRGEKKRARLVSKR